jgi:hypothetical protein
MIMHSNKSSKIKQNRQEQTNYDKSSRTIDGALELDGEGDEGGDASAVERQPFEAEGRGAAAPDLSSRNA